MRMHWSWADYRELPASKLPVLLELLEEEQNRMETQ